MSRSYWNVQVKSGNVWAFDGLLARPNDDVTLQKISTITPIQLVDGEEGYVTPRTKYTHQPINLKWSLDDGTIKAKVENYLMNSDIVKIIDHNDIEYVGKFIDVKPVWLVGTDGDYYDVEAIFKIMPAYIGGITPTDGDAILGEDGGAILDETGGKVQVEDA